MQALNDSSVIAVYNNAYNERDMPVVGIHIKPDIFATLVGSE